MKVWTPRIVLVSTLLSGMVAAASACERKRESAASDGGDAASAHSETTAGALSGTAAPGSRVDREVEPVRLARAALESAGIPLYPGAEGLDATEFEANTAPFVAVDFFCEDQPEKVAAFYDRELKDRVRRRDTARQAGVVRFEFARDYSGVTVQAWDPHGSDSLAMLKRFDRRDMQGVTTEELDRYGKFLSLARTHVVVNVPRPEPAEGES